MKRNKMKKIITFKTFQKVCFHKNDLREIEGGLNCGIAGENHKCTEKKCPTWKRLKEVI